MIGILACLDFVLSKSKQAFFIPIFQKPGKKKNQLTRKLIQEYFSTVPAASGILQIIIKFPHLTGP
jgi:hypothetical protein